MNLPPLHDRRGRRRRGRFIVLEGLDGAGTTTQTAALSRALTARGERHLTTCEPSNGPVGMLLRQALTGRLVGHQGEEPAPLEPTTLALLFAADRADHVSQQVLPALEQGLTVISDRYVLSSIAYQGLDLDLAFVEAINQAAPPPDVTFFLDVPPRVAQARRHAVRGREELYEALALQRRIDRLYRRAIAHRRRHERIEVVDGTLPLEQVTACLLDHLGPSRG
jgi:dTMP kinase